MIMCLPNNRGTLGKNTVIFMILGIAKTVLTYEIFVPKFDGVETYFLEDGTINQENALDYKVCGIGPQYIRILDEGRGVCLDRWTDRFKNKRFRFFLVENIVSSYFGRERVIAKDLETSEIEISILKGFPELLTFEEARILKPSLVLKCPRSRTDLNLISNVNIPSVVLRNLTEGEATSYLEEMTKNCKNVTISEIINGTRVNRTDIDCSDFEVPEVPLNYTGGDLEFNIVKDITPFNTLICSEFQDLCLLSTDFPLNSPGVCYVLPEERKDAKITFIENEELNIQTFYESIRDSKRKPGKDVVGVDFLTWLTNPLTREHIFKANEYVRDTSRDLLSRAKRFFWLIIEELIAIGMMIKVFDKYNAVRSATISAQAVVDQNLENIRQGINYLNQDVKTWFDLSDQERSNLQGLKQTLRRNDRTNNIIIRFFSQIVERLYNTESLILFWQSLREMVLYGNITETKEIYEKALNKTFLFQFETEFGYFFSHSDDNKINIVPFQLNGNFCHHNFNNRRNFMHPIIDENTCGYFYKGTCLDFKGTSREVKSNLDHIGIQFWFYNDRFCDTYVQENKIMLASTYLDKAGIQETKAFETLYLQPEEIILESGMDALMKNMPPAIPEKLIQVFDAPFAVLNQALKAGGKIIDKLTDVAKAINPLYWFMLPWTVWIVTLIPAVFVLLSALAMWKIAFDMPFNPTAISMKLGMSEFGGAGLEQLGGINGVAGILSSGGLPIGDKLPKGMELKDFAEGKPVSGFNFDGLNYTKEPKEMKESDLYPNPERLEKYKKYLQGKEINFDFLGREENDYQ